MWKTRVTQLSVKKKNLSSLSCQLSAEEAYTTVSCNDSVVLSNRLSRCARKSENKRTCFDAGWPWGKRKSRLLWLDGIQFRSPNFFALRFGADSRKLNSDEVRRRCEVQKIVRTQTYDAKILPAASYLDAGRRIKDRGRSVDTYIYISWQKAKSTRNCGARLRLAPIMEKDGYRRAEGIDPELLVALWMSRSAIFPSNMIMFTDFP